MNRKHRNYCFSLNYRLPYIVLKCFFLKEIALITLFHLHWTAFPSLSMGWQLSWLVHGSTNWQSESVNLELPKLFLQPNVPHTHPLETASLMHCGQERCLSAPEHWLKITSYHHRSLRWQSFLWGSCNQVFLVLWWHPWVSLGMVTAFGHVYMGSCCIWVNF